MPQLGRFDMEWVIRVDGPNLDDSARDKIGMSPGRGLGFINEEKHRPLMGTLELNYRLP